MTLLGAFLWLVGGTLVAIGLGVLALRWLFDTDTNGKEIDR